MTDNLTQLDQGGTNCQFVKVNLGPTLGWVMVPVVPELLVTSAAALVLSAGASRVILKAAVKSITLPLVTTWMLANPPTGNLAGFDRSIWIKDFIGSASIGAPIVITPSGTNLIDGLASFSIVGAGELIRLYPLTDLTGWYVG